MKRSMNSSSLTRISCRCFPSGYATSGHQHHRTTNEAPIKIDWCLRKASYSQKIGRWPTPKVLRIRLLNLLHAWVSSEIRRSSNDCGNTRLGKSMLFGWWKVKSYTTSGSCQSANALWRFVICQRLCRFGRVLLLSLRHYKKSRWKILNTPFMSTSHGAVCSSSRRPFRKKTVLHPTLLHGEGITVREQAHFQSACNRFSHVFTVTHHGQLKLKTHDSQFEGCPSIDPNDFHNFWCSSWYFFATYSNT